MLKNKKIIISTIVAILGITNLSILNAGAMKNEKIFNKQTNEIKTSSIENTEFMKKIKNSKVDIMKYINYIRNAEENLKNFDEKAIKNCENSLNSMYLKFIEINNFLANNIPKKTTDKEAKEIDKVLKGISKTQEMIKKMKNNLKTKQKQINFSNNSKSKKEIKKIKELLVSFKEKINNIRKKFKEADLETIKNYEKEIHDICFELEQYRIFVSETNEEEAKIEIIRLSRLTKKIIKNLNRRKQIIANQ